ncbi:hypothetical protein LXL04_030267 [Taraxacum kok-saghyz]
MNRKQKSLGSDSCLSDFQSNLSSISIPQILRFDHKSSDSTLSDSCRPQIIRLNLTSESFIWVSNVDHKSVSLLWRIFLRAEGGCAIRDLDHEGIMGERQMERLWVIDSIFGIGFTIGIRELVGEIAAGIVLERSPTPKIWVLTHFSTTEKEGEIEIDRWPQVAAKSIGKREKGERIILANHPVTTLSRDQKQLFQRRPTAARVCRWQTSPLPFATPLPRPAANSSNSVAAGRSPSTPCSLIKQKDRLNGMAGKQPAVRHLEEFTAGVGHGMEMCSGKVCQRQTPTAGPYRW